MSRVLMLGNFSLHTKGTMRARALPLARALARRGHEVRLVMASLDAPEAAGSSTEASGVRLLHVAPAAPRGIQECATLATLARTALTSDAGVVHAFKPIAYAGAAALLVGALDRFGVRVPHVVVDADDWEGSGGWADLDGRPAWQRAIVDRQEGYLLAGAARLTVASRELASQAGRLGAAPDRVHYLPNGVERVSGPATAQARADARQALGLSGGPYLLLYTRFAEYPLDRVVRLLARVVREQPAARLLVVGRGFRGEEQTLDTLLQQAGLRWATHLAGWVEPNLLPQYFAASDLALYPFADTLSNRAKCPAKLVEVLAAGLPVVAERIGQVSEYVEDGQGGLLVAAGDEHGLASAVLALLEDRVRRETMGEGAAARIAQRFLWDQLVERAEAAYWPATAAQLGRAQVAD